jgi:hypothetical protein
MTLVYSIGMANERLSPHLRYSGDIFVMGDFPFSLDKPDDLIGVFLESHGAGVFYGAL